MKKVYEVNTKQGDTSFGSNRYNVFAENITEAIKKVQEVLDKQEEKQYIDSISLLVVVEEDSDLKEYIEDIEESKKE